MYSLYSNAIIDTKGHGCLNMIDKRIPVDTIMGPSGPTIDILNDEYSRSRSKNYQCNFADELRLDYKTGCAKVFRYTKGRV